MEVASEELNESKEKDASFNFIDTLQFHYENLHSFVSCFISFQLIFSKYSPINIQNKFLLFILLFTIK